MFGRIVLMLAMKYITKQIPVAIQKQMKLKFSFCGLKYMIPSDARKKRMDRNSI